MSSSIIFRIRRESTPNPSHNVRRRKHDAPSYPLPALRGAVLQDRVGVAASRGFVSRRLRCKEEKMTWSSFLLTLAFLITAVIQYGLAIYAIRDLMQRERLRGMNKFSWVLVILCLPFVGTLLYIALATDGLPVPGPHPTSTWPG